MNGPTAAKSHMPFPHRTCARWSVQSAENAENLLRYYAALLWTHRKASGFRMIQPRNPNAVEPPTMNEWGKDNARIALAGRR